MPREAPSSPASEAERRDRFRLAFLVSGIAAVLVAAVGFLGESTVASLTEQITENFFRRKSLVADDVRHKLENHFLKLATLNAHIASLHSHAGAGGDDAGAGLKAVLDSVAELNGPTAVFGVLNSEPEPLNPAAQHAEPPATPLLQTGACSEAVCWRRLIRPDGLWLEARSLHFEADRGMCGAIFAFPLAQSVAQVLDGFEFEPADRLWLLSEDGTVLASMRDPGELGVNLFSETRTCDACHEEAGGLQDWVPKRSDHYMVLPEQHALTVYSGLSLAGQRLNVCLATNHRVLSTQVSNEVWRFALMMMVMMAAVLGLSGWLMITARRRRQAERRALESRQETEQLRLRDQQRRFVEAILEGTDTAIAVVGADQRIQRYNRAFADLFDLPSGGGEDRPLSELLGPVGEVDDDQSLDQLVGRVIVRGEGHRIFELRCSLGDGRAVALDVVLSPLPGPAGVEGAILAVTDATERYRLAEQLARHTQHLETLVVERTRDLADEKEKLDVIVRSIGAGLSLLDEESRVVWTNDVITGWHGRREEIIGKPCWEVFHDRAERCVDCPAVRTLKTGEVAQSEHVHRLAGGGAEQVVRITATPVTDRAGKVVRVLQLIQDVTDQRRLEREMRHAQDLAVLGRLAAGVAHEIGNPLTSISSFIQILRERASDDFTARSLETVFSHIQRISQIVRQMSNLARPPQPVPKPVRLLDPARRVAEVLRRDPRFEGRTISLEAPEGEEPTVETDAALLEQVLLNVAINGLQATRAGGRLRISATPGPVEGEPGERFYRIDVEDDGKGIPAEQRERIFDPFFTTKAHGHGTGLGLHLSRQIALALGGQLILDDTYAEGTRFSVLLPEIFPVTHSAALAAGQGG